MEFILLIILPLIILIFSAILHEVAHGYVADRLGDPTARILGRLTLNPLPHIDLYMTILLPLLLILSGSPIIFGGAKPVPVDPFNLREGRKDMALVALSGPLTNVLLAVIAAIFLHLLAPLQTIAPLSFTHLLFTSFPVLLLQLIVQINLLLAIFNMLPIPPLDGSKVFALLLPEKEAAQYLAIGNIGTFILLFLLMFPVGGFSLSGLISNLLTFAYGLLGL